MPPAQITGFSSSRVETGQDQVITVTNMELMGYTTPTPLNIHSIEDADFTLAGSSVHQPAGIQSSNGASARYSLNVPEYADRLNIDWRYIIGNCSSTGQGTAPEVDICTR